MQYRTHSMYVSFFYFLNFKAALCTLQCLTQLKTLGRAYNKSFYIYMSVFFRLRQVSRARTMIWTLWGSLFNFNRSIFLALGSSIISCIAMKCSQPLTAIVHT